MFQSPDRVDPKPANQALTQRDAEALERSGKEGHTEEEREQQGSDPDSGEPAGSGHRISGSGSSADEYTYNDHGEEGGASHPKP